MILILAFLDLNLWFRHVLNTLQFVKVLTKVEIWVNRQNNEGLTALDMLSHQAINSPDEFYTVQEMLVIVGGKRKNELTHDDNNNSTIISLTEEMDDLKTETSKQWKMKS